MRKLHVAGLILALTTLASCGAVGDGGSDGKDPANGTGETKNWTLTLTVDKSTLNMRQGGTDTVQLTATRGGGFTGPIEFELNQTGGITQTIANNVTTGTVTTALLIVSLTNSYPIGPFGIPVRAHSPSEVVQGSFTNIALNVSAKPGIFVSAGSTLSVGRGSTSGPIPMSLIRTEYDGEVTMSLALGSAPTGITALFNPNPITGTSATMTFSIDAAVPEGTYNIGVRGNGGPYQGTAPLLLTVTPQPTVTFAYATNPITIAKGATAQNVITITRTNFANAVGFITNGTPFGVQAAFAPPSTTTNSVTLTLTISSAAVAGNYTVNVVANPSGLPSVAIPLNLVITP